MNSTTIFFRCTDQVFKIAIVVAFSEEAWLAVIASLNDILRETNQIETWLSGYLSNPFDDGRHLILAAENIRNNCYLTRVFYTEVSNQIPKMLFFNGFENLNAFRKQVV